MFDEEDYLSHGPSQVPATFQRFIPDAKLFKKTTEGEGYRRYKKNPH